MCLFCSATEHKKSSSGSLQKPKKTHPKNLRKVLFFHLTIFLAIIICFLFYLALEWSSAIAEVALMGVSSG